MDGGRRLSEGEADAEPAAPSLGCGAPAAFADPFTAHAFGCILAIGAIEADAGRAPLGRAVGLNRVQLRELAHKWLPRAAPAIEAAAAPERIVFDDEEVQLHSLLLNHRADAAEETAWFAAMVARRSMSDNHLWQDLGLPNRGDLNRLMAERFPALAARNVSNMKWKKFFYRMLCELEGFTLCAAPSCRECSDFDGCFGEESGESLLARIRRDSPAR